MCRFVLMDLVSFLFFLLQMPQHSWQETIQQHRNKIVKNTKTATTMSGMSLQNPKPY